MNIPISGFIRLTAACFLGFGAAYLFAPRFMAAFGGMNATDAVVATDVRAMYGGLQMALGAFLLLNIYKGESPTIALRLLSFVLGGLIAGRCLGFILDPESMLQAEGFHLWALGLFEIPLFVIALVAQRAEGRAIGAEG